jgi:hypothetical protein
MHLALVINSIVCVLGTIGGLLFAVASIISIANMKVAWTTALIVAALLIPVTFVVSGFGAWAAYARGSTQLTIGLIALPWVYGLAFVIAMLVSFKA